MTWAIDWRDIYLGDARGAAHLKSRWARSNALGCAIRPNSQQPASTYPDNTSEFEPYADSSSENVLASAPSAVDHTTGTTSFVAEQTETEFYDGSTEAPRFTRDIVSYDSKEFFATYRKVASSVNRADTQTYHVQDFMNQDQFKFRYQGALGIRGTFKFRVTWNADPMIQGLYLMTYSPPFISETEVDLGAWGNKMWHSQCPYTLINIARDNSAELIIPYVGQTAFLPLCAVPPLPSNQAGILTIIPIFPPASSVFPVDITFNIYFALDNVELFGKQPALAEVQAASAFLGVAEAIRKSRLISKTTGAINTWLDAKPNDNTVKRGVSWVTGGINKIADFLGWSKPFSVLNMQPVILVPYMDMTTSDGTFFGAKLASNSDAGIGYTNINPDEKDPLEFSNLFDRWELMPTYFEIDKETQSGTEIHSIIADPSIYQTPIHVDGISTFTTMAYVSRIFKRWRGTIKIKIVPCATRFHSCRIRVAISQHGTSAQMYDNMSYTHTVIVDLSDPTTWEFDIPYISFNPWRSMPSEEERVIARFYLENPLVAPDNVSSKVPVAIFVKAGDDFEFTQLCQPSTDYIPYLITDPPDANLQCDGQFRSLTVGSDSVIAHQLACGDPIRSLRSQIKRFCLAFRSESKQVRLFGVPITRYTTYDPSTPPDVLTIVGLMFAFARGSLRFVVHSALPLSISADTEAAPNTLVNGCSQVVDEKYSTYAVLHTDGEAARFELPYFANYKNMNIRAMQNAYYNSTSHYPSALVDQVQQTTEITVYRAAADDFDFGFKIPNPGMYRRV